MMNCKISGKDASADGLRGLAALTVVFCHFLISFYPLGFVNLYPGSADERAVEGVMTNFLRIPIVSVAWNGTLAVSIFFVLSGYVLTKAFYETGNSSILRSRIIKRYFRFFIPVLMSVMLSWFVIATGIGYWKEAASLSGSWWLGHFWSFEPSLFNALKDGIYTTLFVGKSLYTPPLWTMKIELIGSLIVLTLASLNINGRAAVITLPLLLVMLYTFAPLDATYYTAFILGSYVNVLNVNLNKTYQYLLLAVALYFGAYDSSGMYEWVRSIAGAGLVINQMAMVFSGFIIVWIVSMGFLKSILESKPVQMLGRLSFSIYLVHFPVILSLSSFVYVYLFEITGGDMAIGISFIATLAAIFPIAYAFMKLFDESSTRLASWVVGTKAPSRDISTPT